MDIIKTIFEHLIAHYELYVVAVMGALMAIIYFVLNVVKKPIKKLTDKIESNRLRHLANKVFIVLAFGFSALFWCILNYVLPQYFAFDGINILLTGAFSIVLYAFADGLSKKDETAKEKALKVVDTIKDIVSDGKVDKKEIKQLANDLSENDTAESELDKLLK